MEESKEVADKKKERDEYDDDSKEEMEQDKTDKNWKGIIGTRKKKDKNVGRKLEEVMALEDRKNKRDDSRKKWSKRRQRQVRNGKEDKL